jgi:hypothetical protein
MRERGNGSAETFEDTSDVEDTSDAAESVAAAVAVAGERTPH